MSAASEKRPVDMPIEGVSLLRTTKSLNIWRANQSGIVQVGVGERFSMGTEQFSIFFLRIVRKNHDR